MNLEELKARVAGKPAPKQAEKKFQHYGSGRSSTRVVTTTGRRIDFTNHQFITGDKDLIDFLNGEIDAGLHGITKGQLMTSEEANPMEALKASHFKEFQEMQAEALKRQALGIERDMGATKATSKMPLNPTSTKAVPAAGSTSAGE